MEKYLSGKVAVVTGGSRGIGKAEAMALSLRGAVVVVIGRNQVKAQKALEEIKGLGGEGLCFQTDVTSAEQVSSLMEATLKQLGRIDILVNNAGILGKDFGKPVVDMGEESWDSVIAVHLKGTFLCTKYAAPIMMKQGSGKIINTASVHGQVGGRPGMADYGAAKAGVIALTKTCARELAPYGILVNAISLGYVDTDMLTQMPPSVRKDLTELQIPLGRLCRPEEVGEVVSWLASPLCTYMTGSIVEVSGGRIDYVYNRSIS